MQAWVQSLNALDWVLLVVVLVSAVAGFLRGIIRSLFSIGGILAGALLGGWYCAQAGVLLQRWITNVTTTKALGFVSIFVVTVVAATLLGNLVRGAASTVGLGFADRMAGAGFGLLRGYLVAAAVLIPLATPVAETAVAKQSRLLPCFLMGSHGISFVLPRDLRQQIAAGLRSLTSEDQH